MLCAFYEAFGKISSHIAVCVALPCPIEKQSGIYWLRLLLIWQCCWQHPVLWREFRFRITLPQKKLPKRSSKDCIYIYDISESISEARELQTFHHRKSCPRFPVREDKYLRENIGAAAASSRSSDENELEISSLFVHSADSTLGKK